MSWFRSADIRYQISGASAALLRVRVEHRAALSCSFRIVLSIVNCKWDHTTHFVHQSNRPTGCVEVIVRGLGTSRQDEG